MKDSTTRSVSMDMREQIFDLLKDRMEKADDYFTKSSWEACFKELMNIQSKIDRIISDEHLKRLMEQTKEKIYGFLALLNMKANNESQRKQLVESWSQLPILVDWYRTEINNSLFDSGILFPMKNVHNTMLGALCEENFNMDNPYEKDYVKTVMGLEKEEIVKLLPKKALEDVYVKVYIENILKEDKKEEIVKNVL